MTYTPTAWADGVTPVNAANLNKIEAAIDALDAFTGVGPDLIVPGDVKVRGGDLFFGASDDANLYRNGAGYLKTDGRFDVGGTMYSTPAASGVGFVYFPVAGGGAAFYSAVQGEPNARFRFSAEGKLEWGVGGSTLTDTALYRSAAGTVKTDGTLRAGGWIFANDGAAAQVIVGPGPSGEAGLNLAGDTNLYRAAAGILKTDGGLIVTGQLSMGATITLSSGAYIYGGASPLGYAVVISRAAGDADNRFTLSNDGHMYFGDGTNPIDAQLYRTGVGTLRTDGAMYFGSNIVGQGSIYNQPAGAGGGFNYNPGAAGGYAFYLSIQGETNQRFHIDSNGAHAWGSGSATVDTNLYRAGVGALRTDGALYTGASVVVDFNNLAGRLYFGSALDTSLYRGAAGVLKTDGQVEVGATGIKFSDGSVQTKAGAGSMVLIAEKILAAPATRFDFDVSGGTFPTTGYRKLHIEFELGCGPTQDDLTDPTFNIHPIPAAGNMLVGIDGAGLGTNYTPNESVLRLGRMYAHTSLGLGSLLMFGEIEIGPGWNRSERHGGHFRVIGKRDVAGGGNDVQMTHGGFLLPAGTVHAPITGFEIVSSGPTFPIGSRVILYGIV